MANTYSKYKISKSLNGDTIVYLARVGKQQKLVMRADSEEKLIKLMAAEAKRVDDEIAAKQKAAAEKIAAQSTQKKKKLGLWKPGKLLQNDAAASDSSEAESGSTTTQPVKTVEDLT